MKSIRDGHSIPNPAAHLNALAKAVTAFRTAVTSSSLPDKTALIEGLTSFANVSSAGEQAWSQDDPSNAAYVQGELYVAMSTITRSLVQYGAPATSKTPQPASA